MWYCVNILFISSFSGWLMNIEFFHIWAIRLEHHQFVYDIFCYVWKFGLVIISNMLISFMCDCGVLLSFNSCFNIPAVTFMRIFVYTLDISNYSSVELWGICLSLVLITSSVLIFNELHVLSFSVHFIRISRFLATLCAGGNILFLSVLTGMVSCVFCGGNLNLGLVVLLL